MGSLACEHQNIRQEKVRAPRIFVNWDLISHHPFVGVIPGYVVNISETGLLMWVKEACEIGAVMEVDLILAHSIYVHVRIQIVRLHILTGDAYCYGTQFVEMTSKDRLLLNECLT
jgi:hypothetical protein